MSMYERPSSEWLQSISVGDTVGVPTYGGLSRMLTRPMKISRLTPKQFVIGGGRVEYRANRSDGSIVGNGFYSIQEWTSELDSEYREFKDRADLRNEWHSFDALKAPLPVVRAVLAALRTERVPAPNPQPSAGGEAAPLHAVVGCDESQEANP